MLEPQVLVHQFTYDDGENFLLPLADLKEHNITFEGGFDKETIYMVPSIFDKEGVEYKNDHLYVEENIINIKKDIKVYQEKFIKFRETTHGFEFAYPIKVLTCAFTPVADVEPVRIKGELFTFGVSRG